MKIHYRCSLAKLTMYRCEEQGRHRGRRHEGFAAHMLSITAPEYVRNDKTPTI